MAQWVKTLPIKLALSLMELQSQGIGHAVGTRHAV